LICLPECSFTGYLYAQEDFIRFAETIPGATTEKIARLAHAHNANICFGMLESTAQGVYNSAVLLDRTGAICCVHRKIVEQPPFLNGICMTSTDTEFGRLGILVCGDLFDDKVVGMLDPRLRLLIVPISRSFDGTSPDRARWEPEERPVYQDAVKKAGLPTLIVNTLEFGTDEGSFGGEMIVHPDGSIMAESPHGTDEILMVDFDQGL
jgi:predicted amidohydrolase